MAAVETRKRGFGDFDMTPPPACHSSPMKIGFLQTPMKRQRAVDGDMGEGRAGGASRAFQPDSPFSSSGMAAEGTPEELKSLIKKKSRVEAEATGGRLYTEAEVRDVVSNMLAVREAQLRQEYDKILQEKLADQFQQFAKFNEDYISRNWRNNTDFSYLS